MNKYALVLVFAYSSFVFAECDTSIQESDTVATVRQKMACLASEVASLKQEVQAQKEAYRPMSITSRGDYGDPKPASYVRSCKNSAIAKLTAREWKTKEGPSYVAATNKNNSILVSCKYPDVIVTGPVPNEIKDITDVFHNLIFE